MISTTEESQMARTRSPRRHDELMLTRTRSSSVWVAVGVAVLFLLLLIVFIAQNNRQVPIHFFTASGRVSEALALLVAAVAGALVVLMAGAARVIQLRVTARRHNRQVRAGATADAATTASAAASPTPPAERGADPVQAEGHP
jgi:uncharacterized integral membrane protein